MKRMERRLTFKIIKYDLHYLGLLNKNIKFAIRQLHKKAAFNGQPSCIIFCMNDLYALISNQEYSIAE